MPTCKQCGEEFPRLSQHKLCDDCGERNVEEAARQMRAKSGPYYERWKQAREAWIVDKAAELKKTREVTEK